LAAQICIAFFKHRLKYRDDRVSAKPQSVGCALASRARRLSRRKRASVDPVNRNPSPRAANTVTSKIYIKGSMIAGIAGPERPSPLVALCSCSISRTAKAGINGTFRVLMELGELAGGPRKKYPDHLRSARVVE
jgi:hypothetical protein